jgi:cell division septation protein DedD
MSYQQFGHVDPEERLDYADEPAPGIAEEYYAPRRLMPGVILMVTVMAVFAGGLWFAYHAGERHAENAAASVAPASAPGPGIAATNAQVPLIRADTDPVKVKPDKAGGMNIPDRNDPIYSMQQSASPAEHILPPPEAPAPRPLAPPPQVAAVPQGAAPGTQLPPMTAPGALPGAATRPAPKPEAAGPPVKVQLASLRTPDEARGEWARVKGENTDLLGKFTAVAVRADLGDRGIWYRVEVGPVGDRTAALKLCKALKDRDLGCQIVP